MSLARRRGAAKASGSGDAGGGAFETVSFLEQTILTKRCAPHPLKFEEGSCEGSKSYSDTLHGAVNGRKISELPNPHGAELGALGSSPHPIVS